MLTDLSIFTIDELIDNLKIEEDFKTVYEEAIEIIEEKKKKSFWFRN